MRLAIMQPYFLPYIGYFQLIAAVDMFIVYDNIKYTKKGWINRNRMLQNGKDVMFSLPLKSGSDSLDVCERELAADFNRDKLLNQFKGAYRRAPYFEQTFPLVEQIVRHEEANLFRYLSHSLVKTCEHLGIVTEIRTSSEVVIDHDLKNQDKVLALCGAVGATTYVNAIGGMELYSKETFREKGIELKFIRSKPFEYPQFDAAFVPWLSIIDVMMFNPVPVIQGQLSQRDLI
ncbi:MAG: WbqC family protein [Sideroxyarcus sp.]|nr:WbqC family protein [Sideroxyarcus sp.]